MVRLTRIYTRTGDDGTTGLADGSRRSKDDLRLESYGTVDELNSVLGACAVVLSRDEGAGGAEAQAADLAHLIGRVQNDLFDLGADLATPGTREGLRITPAQVVRLEQAIDHWNADLPALSSFVLPGGTELATWLHLARTVCRRAERWTVRLGQEEEISASVIPYLNRLSDLLFVLARVANGGGRADVLWVPGKHRD